MTISPVRFDTVRLPQMTKGEVVCIVAGASFGGAVIARLFEVCVNKFLTPQPTSVSVNPDEGSQRYWGSHAPSPFFSRKPSRRNSPSPVPFIQNSDSRITMDVDIKPGEGRLSLNLATGKWEFENDSSAVECSPISCEGQTLKNNLFDKDSKCSGRNFIPPSFLYEAPQDKKKLIQAYCAEHVVVVCDSSIPKLYYVIRSKEPEERVVISGSRCFEGGEEVPEEYGMNISWGGEAYVMCNVPAGQLNGLEIRDNQIYSVSSASLYTHSGKKKEDISVDRGCLRLAGSQSSELPLQPLRVAIPDISSREASASVGGN